MKGTLSCLPGFSGASSATTPITLPSLSRDRFFCLTALAAGAVLMLSRLLGSAGYFRIAREQAPAAAPPNMPTFSLCRSSNPNYRAVMPEKRGYR